MAAESKRQEHAIVFVHGSVTPSKNEPWTYCSALLLNPCDGYHHVFARFDGEGHFYGFFDWADSTPYPDDFYVAWALLPDELPLIAHFDPKRDPSSSASHGVDSPAPAEPWQEGVMRRVAFERGVSAMRDLAILAIEARHESGYDCSPWLLVKAIRAAKDPTNPYGVSASDGKTFSRTDASVAPAKEAAE